LPLLTWRFALASVLLFAYLALRRPSLVIAPLADVARYGTLALCAVRCRFDLLLLRAQVCGRFGRGGAALHVSAMVAVAESVFYGRSFTPLRMLAVALTFGGCVLVLDPFASEEP